MMMDMKTLPNEITLICSSLPPDFCVEGRSVEPLGELHLECGDLGEALGHPLQRVLRLALAVLRSLHARRARLA